MQRTSSWKQLIMQSKSLSKARVHSLVQGSSGWDHCSVLGMWWRYGSSILYSLFLRIFARFLAHKLHFYLTFQLPSSVPSHIQIPNIICTQGKTHPRQKERVVFDEFFYPNPISSWDTGQCPKRLSLSSVATLSRAFRKTPNERH